MRCTSRSTAARRGRRPRSAAPTGKCFAPDVAFSADGTLYLSYVTLAGPGNVPNEVWLSSSKDGGRTLTRAGQDPGQARLPGAPRRRPVTARAAVHDLAAGRDVGTLKFTGPGNPVNIIRSDDAGATWSQPVRVSGAARGRVVAPSPVVGRDGSVYVLYNDLGDDRLDYEGGHLGRGGPPYPGPTSLVLARSRDAGATWAESVVADDLVPMKRFLVFLPEFPSVAVDGDGRVYAAFHSNTLGDPDVYLWTLDGETWKGPTRVNDTARRDGRAQYLPKLAVAPDGRLDVLYYDRRADAENLRNHVSLQSSFDHGATFTPSVRLSSRPSDSRIGFGAKEGLPDLGSRLGLISGDRAALGLWTDTRAGVPETQKQDLAAAAVAVTDPEAALGRRQGRAALRRHPRRPARAGPAGTVRHRPQSAAPTPRSRPEPTARSSPADMCSTCVMVLHMSKMIQVRDVPDDVHRTIKMRAAAAGMSLSDYIKRDLEIAASQPTLDEIDARVRGRRESGLRTATIVSTLRELRDA